jgi:hypothetical protein
MSTSEIAAAVELGRSGKPAEARAALEALWDRAGDDTERCTIAHFLADLQEDPADELVWDERALAAAPADDPGVRAFFPSLLLNLADVHRRLGHFDTARDFLARSGAVLDRLPEGEYGDLIRTGFTAVTAALDDGSTGKLV